MFKKIIFFAFLLSPLLLFSQTLPISQARTLPTGSAVTVRGIDCRIREIRPVDGERWRASQRAAGTQESAEPAL